MRTFIAIEIPDEIKQQMVGIQKSLKNTSVDASWPRPEGIHLTLKFLGEVPDSKVPDIANALKDSVQGTSRFRLEVGGVGAFPNARNARVVWVGLSGELENLNRLQTAVEEAMARIGMKREERAFKPHLTLGRIRYIGSKEGWLRALEQLKDVRLPGFEVSGVNLMKSELKRSGAEYTEIAKVGLR